MLLLLIFITIITIIFWLLPAPQANYEGLSTIPQRSTKPLISILKNPLYVSKPKKHNNVRFADTRNESIYSKKTNKIVDNIVADT